MSKKITKEDFGFNKETKSYEIYINGMRYEIPERHWASMTEQTLNEMLPQPNPDYIHTPSEPFGEDFQMLTDMYNDEYFPDFLVDKVKNELEKVIAFLETGERDKDKIQSEFDRAIMAINDLENEFDQNDSELETVARESICEGVEYIIGKFNLNITNDEAVRERNF